MLFKRPPLHTNTILGPGYNLSPSPCSLSAKLAAFQWEIACQKHCVLQCTFIFLAIWPDFAHFVHQCSVSTTHHSLPLRLCNQCGTAFRSWPCPLVILAPFVTLSAQRIGLAVMGVNPVTSTGAARLLLDLTDSCRPLSQAWVPILTLWGVKALQ